MAKGNSSTNSAPERSASVEVTDQTQARALLAAWDGVYHFFGGRVSNWELVQPNESNPVGGLIAHGFTVMGAYDPNRILSDIGGRNRRLEIFPNIFYVLNDLTPPEFTENQDMTNWMVQYAKGSVEEGTAKTPEYIRKAVADYKAAHGLKTRRGPKLKIIRLDNLGELDESQLSQIDPDELSKFLILAQKVQAANPVTPTVNGTEQSANESPSEAVAVS